MMYNTTPFLLIKIWLNSMTCCIDLQSTNLLVASPTTLEFHSSLLLAIISAAMQYQMRRPYNKMAVRSLISFLVL